MKSVVEFLIHLYYCLCAYIVRLLFPVRKGRILMWSTSGVFYSCNPKYITEYLINNYGSEYDIIWAFKKGAALDKVPSNVHTIVKSIGRTHLLTIRFIFYLNTSQFIITNFRTHGHELFMDKRQGQRYIQTWHASWGPKPIENEAHKPTQKELETQRKENARTDLMISSCPERTDQIRNAQEFQGEVLECGTPRVDMMFSPDTHICIRYKVYTALGIPAHIKTVLYAPTFRDHDVMNFEAYMLNWQQLTESLQQRFGGEFRILLRLHSIITSRIKEAGSLSFGNKVINVLDYPDMQELLVASDVLITDYSSSPFDFCYTMRPCFLYMQDYDTYIKRDRTALKISLSDMPFPCAFKENTLVENILSFNEEQYKSRLQHYLRNVMHTFENGHASEAVCKWLQQQQI